MIEDNFIGIFENALTPEFCNEAISYFESMKEMGYAVDRATADGVHKLQKDDEAVFMHYEQFISIKNTRKLSAEFNAVLWNKCYPEYSKTFSALKEIAPHGSFSTKLQKTEVGGGYHMWHSEIHGKDNANRILGWMAYLNDVEEGGETEFLYQHKRIKPKAGTIVIWPAAFTHTHRGNPPLSNSKYIITGGIEF